MSNISTQISYSHSQSPPCGSSRWTALSPCTGQHTSPKNPFLVVLRRPGLLLSLHSCFLYLPLPPLTTPRDLSPFSFAIQILLVPEGEAQIPLPPNLAHTVILSPSQLEKQVCPLPALALSLAWPLFDASRSCLPGRVEALEVQF